MTPLEALANPQPLDTLCAWLWMAHLLGPACPEAGAYLALYGGPVEFYRAVVEGDTRLPLSISQQKRMLEACPADFQQEIDRCRRTGVAIITPTDFAYPPALAALPDLPLVLYATGDTAVLEGCSFVGMVGSRRPTPYGRDAAAQLGEALAKGGAVIVSGMAEGLDSMAHRAALQAGQKTVAVLGTAIDVTYPAANAGLRREIEANGCVISEYGPGAVGFSSYFLQRNRIIAGISQALLVVEARLRSGTLNTAGHAERYGKPLFALPGSIFNPGSGGTNDLLAAGRARACVSGREILRCIGLEDETRAEPENPGKKEKQKKTDPLLAAMGRQPMGLSTLMEKTGRTAQQLLPELMRLELAGSVESLPGGLYRLR